MGYPGAFHPTETLLSLSMAKGRLMNRKERTPKLGDGSSHRNWGLSSKQRPLAEVSAKKTQVICDSHAAAPGDMKPLLETSWRVGSPHFRPLPRGSCDMIKGGTSKSQWAGLLKAGLGAEHSTSPNPDLPCPPLPALRPPHCPIVGLKPSR